MIDDDGGGGDSDDDDDDDGGGGSSDDVYDDCLHDHGTGPDQTYHASQFIFS